MTSGADTATAWGTVGTAVAAVAALVVTMVLAGRDRRAADARLLKERTDADARLAAERRDADERIARETQRGRVARQREMQLGNLRELADLYATGHYTMFDSDATTRARMVMLVHLLPPEIATCMRYELGIGPPLSQAMMVKVQRYHEHLYGAGNGVSNPQSVKPDAVWLEIADDVDILMTGVPSWAISDMNLATTMQQRPSMQRLLLDQQE
jgi:hypothetical protein